MNEKERLLAILHNKETDRPACICPGGMMNMITADLMKSTDIWWPQAHTDADLMAKLAGASYEQGCFENTGVPFCMTVEAEAMGAEVTLGTGLFEPHVEQYAMESVSQWRELPQPDFYSGRGNVVLNALRLLSRNYPQVPAVGNITGPLSIAGSLMEPTVLYRELRKKREDAHAFLDFITRQAIRFANAQILAGADVIAISDPGGTGEILGPKLFEEFAVKYLNQLLSGLLPQRGGTIVHICGQMKSVYKQVNKITADALSFDSVVPMKEAKKQLPDRVIMGNISTYALEFSTPEKVAELTELCAEASADIVAPACGLGTKSSMDNITSILKTLKRRAI